MDNLPWAVRRLHEEVLEGGVDFHPEDAVSRRPCFLQRDRSWVIRARGPSGAIRRKSIVVPTFATDARGVRRPLSADEFLSAKAEKAEDLVAWRDAVEEGFEE